MYAPKLYETETSRDIIQTFGGYNHNIRIADNEFYDMKNLTSDNYPTLSPRVKRGVVSRIERCNGLLAKDKLAYVEGNTLRYGDFSMELRNIDADRQLVSMGSYIVVCPDMMYVNTADLTDFGDSSKKILTGTADIAYVTVDEKGNEITATHYKSPSGQLSFAESYRYALGQTYNTGIRESEWSGFYTTDCEMSIVDGYVHLTFDTLGVAYLYAYWSDEDIEDGSDDSYENEYSFNVEDPAPAPGDKLLDLSGDTPVLYECLTAGQWSATDTKVCLKLRSWDINVMAERLLVGGNYYFEINSSKPCYEHLGYLYKRRSPITVVSAVDEGNYTTVILRGTALYGVKNDNEIAEINVYEASPSMDHIIESGNRLWGCRYGKNENGEFVNEIYATALGEIGVWQKYEGTSTDSYTVSLGSDGPFTGAVNYRGTPMFFKESCCHMIYGSYPATYQVVTDTGMGLRKGDHKSLCVLGNVLFYKAVDGIYTYDGASVDKISNALGLKIYGDAVAGAVDSKYYVAMTDENGTRSLFVYDAAKGLWHKEDGTDARYFARYEGDLWYYDGSTQMLCTVKGTQGKSESGDVEWFAETGIMGYYTPDAKYVGKVQMRIMLPVGSRVSLYIEYDSDGYMEFMGGIEGKSFHYFPIPIMPRRCDHFKLRIEGVGECKIFSISKVMEEGGDL